MDESNVQPPGGSGRLHQPPHKKETIMPRGGSVKGRKLNRVNLVGQRFNSLTVIERVDNKPGRHSQWKCACDCGTITTASQNQLKFGTKRTCGCREGAFVHGHAIRELKSREYRSWQAAKQRCGNPKNTAYRWYGARGIEMCERWSNSFEAFFEDMGPRPINQTLDRIDPDGDYEPGNCRWATKAVQAANQRKPGTVT